MNVQVNTINEELSFAVHSSATGKQLFDQVTKLIGIRETWFFGLQYIDTKGAVTWLQLDKKIVKQRVHKSTPKTLQFKFLVKFYPEDVSEINQDITMQLFFLQVKNDILSDVVQSSADESVMLSSYAMQAKYGDLVPDTYGCVLNETLVAQRVQTLLRLTDDQLKDMVVTRWAELKNMTKEDAIKAYMEIAQQLEMYGISFFDVQLLGDEGMARSGLGLAVLGVGRLGLNFYQKDDLAKPRLVFPWEYIKCIRDSRNKFVVKNHNKKVTKITFFVPRLQIKRTIQALCTGNMELHHIRNEPASLEVKRIVAEAHQQKLEKQKQRDRFVEEIAGRERKQIEYRDRLELVQSEMEQAQRELTKAQQTIQKLEAQLREVQQAKEELDKKELELIRMNQRIQQEKEMEASEKEELVNSIRHREDEVQQMREQVNEKMEETAQLQWECEEVRLRQQKASQPYLKAIEELMKQTAVHSDTGVHDDDDAKFSLLSGDMSKLIAQKEMNITQLVNLNSHGYDALTIVCETMRMKNELDVNAQIRLVQLNEIYQRKLQKVADFRDTLEKGNFTAMASKLGEAMEIQHHEPEKEQRNGNTDLSVKYPTDMTSRISKALHEVFHTHEKLDPNKFVGRLVIAGVLENADFLRTASSSRIDRQKLFVQEMSSHGLKGYDALITALEQNLVDEKIIEAVKSKREFLT